MSAPVTPSDLRRRAQALYRRDARAWAADAEAAPVIDLPLHPPTQAAVLADLAGAIAWVGEWREESRVASLEVTWTTRRWSSAGVQQVPERVRVTGADAIAELSGETDAFRRMRTRCYTLRRDLTDAGADPAAIIPVLTRHAGTVAALPGADFAVLSDVVEWLMANPVSGRRPRELPIRGIDTKWLGSHRSLVEALVGVATGEAGLGLSTSQSTVRIRALDPDLAIGGLDDLAAPAPALAALDIAPATVVIIENLETFLALPPISGAVAIHGSGYAAVRAADFPWVRVARVLYWGDLDSDGFAILDQVRAAGLEVASVLMGAATLEAYRDLWVPDPKPVTRALEHLDAGEAEALAALREHGWPRLEQERIPWEAATRVLGEVLVRD